MRTWFTLQRVSRAASLVSVVVAGIATTAPVAAAPWSTPLPASHVFEPSPACPYKGKSTHYRVCDDQMAMVAAGLVEARRQGKLLLVIVGAPWCGYCNVLHTKLPGPELLGHKGEALDYAASFHVVAVAMSAVSKGRRMAVPSGEAVIDAALARARHTKLRAIPFFIVLNPADENKAYARNLDDIVRRDEIGHDWAKVRAVLREAHAYLRHGVTPAEEASWLRRKLMKVLGR